MTTYMSTFDMFMFFILFGIPCAFLIGIPCLILYHYIKEYMENRTKLKEIRKEEMERLYRDCLKRISSMKSLQ